jgi:uncharacterized protein (UPF0548 family)
VSRFNYPEVGATREQVLPGGYHHLRYRAPLPAGSFETAGEAVLTFRMHGAAGVKVRTSALRAEPGVALTAGLGIGPVRLWAPCEVVWAVDDEHRAGFAYGTLPGHPQRGEEAFLVERDDAGRVWFGATAFSRPDRWFTRIGGPVVVAFQHAYARRLGTTLRRLSGGGG